LVWLGGIGSLLAVAFALRARQRIRRSAGAERGEGLAVAGLVLGVLGLLGAVLFWLSVVAIGAGVHRALVELTPKTITVRAGQPVTIDPSAVDDGITGVTVFSVQQPVSPPSSFDQPEPGKELAAADIRVCAGSAGSHGPSDVLFQLVFADGTTTSPTFMLDHQPDLGSIKALGADQCARGFVTYEIASGTAPVGVRYQAGLLRNYDWDL
jgi:hypothetical protein